MYRIEIEKKTLKELEKLPTNIIIKFRKKFEELAENPYNVSGVKKLINPKSLNINLDEIYRVRVGDYRAIYAINNDVLIILVLKISHRKDVYIT